MPDQNFTPPENQYPEPQLAPQPEPQAWVQPQPTENYSAPVGSGVVSVAKTSFFTSKLFMIIASIVGLVILGVGGWFGYKAFMKPNSNSLIGKSDKTVVSEKSNDTDEFKPITKEFDGWRVTLTYYEDGASDDIPGTSLSGESRWIVASITAKNISSETRVNDIAVVTYVYDSPVPFNAKSFLARDIAPGEEWSANYYTPASNSINPTEITLMTFDDDFNKRGSTSFAVK